MTQKYAVITGASRGIGRALALAFAQEGMNLLLTGRNIDKLNEVKEECEKNKVEVQIVACDLADLSGIETLANRISNLPQVDCLINNAGVAIPKSLVDTSLEEWELHMNLNVRTPFLLIKSSLDKLRKSDKPTIINISSVTGSKGYPNQGAYSSSKHALMGLTKVFSKELHNEGIRVFCISPGGVATDMVANTRPDLDLSCLVDPMEVANTALFLYRLKGNAMIDEINIRRVSNEPWK